MEIFQNDRYELDIPLEWDTFLEKNVKKIGNGFKKELYTKYKEFYSTLYYYPLYTDGGTLYLYRDGFIARGNTMDLLQVGFIEPITTSHMNCDEYLYKQLLLLSTKDYKLKPLEPNIKHEFLDYMIHKDHKLMRQEKGTISDEYIFLKKVPNSILLWRVKLGAQQQVIVSHIFTIPDEVVQAIIETSTRSTDKENEYFDYYGIFNNLESLWYSCGAPQDPLKMVKTRYFENWKQLDAYKLFLKEKNLEDSLESATQYFKVLQDKLKEERLKFIKTSKGVL